MKAIFALLGVCTALLLTGCDKPENTSAAPDPANTLTVLAGSELKDIEPLLPKLAQATGVTLQMRYVGTLEAVERLQSGEDVDAAWLASNRYAMLVPAARARIVTSERTMLTPVVLGLKDSKATELGWKNNPNVTWKDIANAATQGRFTFGMTSPVSSNTGFSALLGVAAALSGKGDALQEKDIDGKRLAAFFKAQRMTSGSSGWLADAWLKDPGKVDGIINYASTLQSMNRSPALTDKLVLIYPQDGIITADYPLMLVKADKRAHYDKVVAYLRGAEFQKSMAEQTLRRPVNPDVVVVDSTPQALIELPFPAKLDVVDAILAAFDNELRLPTDSSFVLDKSGSMQNDRIAALKTAMLGLSGADGSISGRFARFRNRERIFLLPFSDTFGAVERFDMGVDAASNQVTMAALAKRINALEAHGGTAIFSAVQKTYQEAVQRRRQDAERFYSIVIMTDGVNNNGISVEQFSDWYAQLPASDKGIKLFPVLFGEANPAELQRLADLTGGRTFDSRKSSLQAIFKDIRGYQ